MNIPPVEQVNRINKTRHSTDYPFVKYPQYVPTTYKRQKAIAKKKSTTTVYDEAIISDEARALLENQKKDT